MKAIGINVKFPFPVFAREERIKAPHRDTAAGLRVVPVGLFIAPQERRLPRVFHDIDEEGVCRERVTLRVIHIYARETALEDEPFAAIRPKAPCECIPVFMPKPQVAAMKEPRLRRPAVFMRIFVVSCLPAMMAAHHGKPRRCIAVAREPALDAHRGKRFRSLSKIQERITFAK